MPSPEYGMYPGGRLRGQHGHRGKVTKSMDPRRPPGGGGLLAETGCLGGSSHGNSWDRPTMVHSTECLPIRFSTATPASLHPFLMQGDLSIPLHTAPQMLLTPSQ